MLTQSTVESADCCGKCEWAFKKSWSALAPPIYNKKWQWQLPRSLSNITTVYPLLALSMGCGVVEWLVLWQCNQNSLDSTQKKAILFQEYLLITEDTTCHVSDLTLSIIDTPGIEDTAGPMQVEEINVFFRNWVNLGSCFFIFSSFQIIGVQFFKWASPGIFSVYFQ